MRKIRLEYFDYKHRGRKRAIEPDRVVTIVDNKTGIVYTGSPLHGELMREPLSRFLGMKDPWANCYTGVAR